MSGVRGFRHSLVSFVPPWLALRPGFRFGFSVLFVLAAACDVAMQAILQGTRAGWPGADGRTDNLSAIGFTRGLVQGETETATHFQGRLRAWLSTQAQAGSDVMLATQIHEWLGNNPQVRIWTRYRCTTVNADGTIRFPQPGDGVLDWDSISNPERQSSVGDDWIVIYPDENTYAPNINASPRTGVIPSTDPRRAVGIGHLCTRVQRDTVLALVNTWKAAHAHINMIVWTTNAALFDPANVSEAGNPDGKWGRNSFWGACPAGTVGSGIGTWPSRRRVDCRYWVPGS
jgi:hypothetical protein